VAAPEAAASLTVVMPPVLCYHRVGGPLELGVTRISRTVFAHQMRSLARNGWKTLTLTEFTEGLTLPPSPVLHRAFLLTFDDGYAGLDDHAFPILADMGFTATTFLITDYVGRTNAWDARYTWRRLAHLNWDTIERWRARGFEFASHAATHRRLTWLSNEAVADELGRSRAVLVQRLGPEAGRAIAYPFGAVDGRIVRRAREAGYTLGFGGVKGNGDPLHLSRVPTYFWDRGNVPFGLRNDGLGAVGRFIAHVANRCAVGTTILKTVWPYRRMAV
jgi:peptidoglycan/xylan/chitin deacetylase (PgdA/CDA1 family)